MVLKKPELVKKLDGFDKFKNVFDIIIDERFKDEEQGEEDKNDKEDKSPADAADAAPADAPPADAADTAPADTAETTGGNPNPEESDTESAAPADTGTDTDAAPAGTGAEPTAPAAIEPENEDGDEESKDEEEESKDEEVVKKDKKNNLTTRQQFVKGFLDVIENNKNTILKKDKIINFILGIDEEYKYFFTDEDIEESKSDDEKLLNRMRKTGDAMKKGVAKTGDAMKKGVAKTGEAISNFFRKKKKGEPDVSGNTIKDDEENNEQKPSRFSGFSSFFKRKGPDTKGDEPPTEGDESDTKEEQTPSPTEGNETGTEGQQLNKGGWFRRGGSSNKTKRIKYISNNKTRRKLG